MTLGAVRTSALSALGFFSLTSCVTDDVQDEESVRQEAWRPDQPLACEPPEGVMSSGGSIPVYYVVGDGLVGSMEFGIGVPRVVGTTANMQWNVTDCASGERLSVKVSSSNSESDPDGTFNHVPRFNRFHGKTMSDKPNSLGEIRRSAFSSGLGTDTLSFDMENCGCAVFYPELRGDKAAFDDHYGWAGLSQNETTGATQ